MKMKIMLLLMPAAAALVLSACATCGSRPLSNAVAERAQFKYGAVASIDIVNAHNQVIFRQQIMGCAVHTGRVNEPVCTGSHANPAVGATEYVFARNPGSRLAPGNTYRIRVHLDDGQFQIMLEQYGYAHLRVGDRVLLDNGDVFRI